MTWVPLRLSAEARYAHLNSGPGLLGVRDRYEITAALREGLVAAPDEGSRYSIERLMAVANSAPVFLGPDDTDTSASIPGVIDVDTIGTNVTPTGPTTTEPGTTEPGTTEPGTTEPGTAGVGRPGTRTDPGTDPGAPTSSTDPAQVIANAGAALGGRVAAELGLPEADGAAVGSQWAVLYAPQFDETSDGSSSETSASSRFWGIVGGVVGFVLGGPVGAAVGATAGATFGTSSVGVAGAQLVGSVFSTVVDSTGLSPTDITAAVACVLRGPECIPGVLAAESGH